MLGHSLAPAGAAHLAADCRQREPLPWVVDLRDLEAARAARNVAAAVS